MRLFEMYRLLGVSPGACIDEIKESYRRIAKRCHPDVNPDGLYGDHFSRVTEAYHGLVEAKRKQSLVNFPVRDSFKTKSAPISPFREQNIFILGEQLLTAASASVRAFAARSLGNSGKKSAYVFLRKALFDKDPLVVKSAVRAVGSLKILQSSGELSAVFFRGNRDIRRQVIGAIHEMGNSDKFKPILIEGCRDEDLFIRQESRRLLHTASGEAAYAQ
jgi:hypothetical protein